MSIRDKIIAGTATEAELASVTGAIDLSYTAVSGVLRLPAAETVYARGCTGLTSLELPAAETVYADGCTGLTSLELPAATHVYADGCTGLPDTIRLADDGKYALLWLNGRYLAGCRNFDRHEALAHWTENRGRDQARADLYRAAIEAHQPEGEK